MRTVTSNDINKGTVSGSGTYAYGAEVTATATEIAGHEFIGWYQGATLKATSSVYTFTMPYNALSLEARFVTQYNVDISSISDSSKLTRSQTVTNVLVLQKGIQLIESLIDKKYGGGIR